MAIDTTLAPVRRTLLAEATPALDRWVGSLVETTAARAAAWAVTVHGGHSAGSVVSRSAAGPALLPSGTELHDALGGGDRETDYAEEPILVSGRPIGRVGIAAGPADTLAERDRRALQRTAGGISLELELRLARDDEDRQRDLVASHERVHDLIAGDAPLKEILSELTTSLHRYEPTVDPCVVLIDPETNTMHPGAGPTLPPDFIAAIDGVVIGPNVGSCGSAAWSRELVICEDLATDPRWAPIAEFVTGFGLAHCWSMPILSAAGDVLATLAFYGRRPRRPTDAHLALMRAGARLAGIAIERDRTMRQLIRDARVDGLTGLPNRRAVLEHLEDTLSNGSREAQTAVLFIDLDGLKVLNDTLGHDRADMIIREVGLRLPEVLRDHDFVGRLGGDEFIIVAPGVDGELQATALARRVLAAVSRPLDGIADRRVAASVGIALVDTSVDASEAIRRADDAMYEAKRAGGDRCAFFGSGGRMETGRRPALARALRGAEMRGEMTLMYRLEVDVARARQSAYEVEIRWNTATYGVVEPAEFVPIAEDNGAILTLGAWALREACEAASALLSPEGGPERVSVPVSPRQLSQPGFSRSVYQLIAHAQTQAERLTLLVPQAAISGGDARVDAALGELHALGVRLVLCEVDAGALALRHLASLPFDGLRLAAPLLADAAENPVTGAVITAIVQVAETLGWSAGAAGVDTPAQLDAARAVGCTLVVGDAAGPAVPAERLARVPAPH